jgi:hypothetical protein
MFRRGDRPVELGSYKGLATRGVFCGSADLLREGRLMFHRGATFGGWAA